MEDSANSANLQDFTEISANHSASNTQQQVDSAILHLAAQGFALHWLKHRSKAPIAEAWSSAPVNSPIDLRGSYRPGYNTGVRLGAPSRVGALHLYVLDLDVRDPASIEEARAKLRELLPEFETLPTVISGSGGASRHYYFLAHGEYRSKKLAHSAAKFTGKDGKQHWAWEIELFGTGKQVAMPPSIHPDTGRAYRWEREFDFDLVEMGLGPVVGADRIAGWTAGVTSSAPAAEEDDDDLAAVAHAQPMDLTDEEIHRTLYDLPVDEWCEDRDGWLNVGMALHHQYQGSNKGLLLWNEFSSRSKKYDAKDQARVWKSFAISGKSLRFAILLKAAANARLQAELSALDEFEEEEDDDEDLIGEAEDDDPFGFQTPATGQTDDEDLIGDTSATAKPGLEWVSKLDLNEDGAIKSTLPNVKLIFRNDRRTCGLAALNQFTGETVQRAPPGRGLGMRKRPSPKGSKQLEGPIWQLRDPVNGDLWTDDKDNAVRDLFESPKAQGGYGIKISDRDLKAAVDLVARDNAFHPVREYLGRLVWDRRPRLDTMFIRYLGAADTSYTRSVARMTLVGGVARVMKPGHKFDFATILEGLQGKRKSTFIELLAKNWFSELHADFRDPRQMVESMQGSWILEIPELSGFGRADVRTIKAFISGKRDKVRLAYARRAHSFERQCIFIGSTNDREYLRDDTGGRRFWPIACQVTEIDTDGFRGEVDQLWAEAKVVYDQMRVERPHGDLPLYLADEAANDEAVRIQEDRRVETAEDALAGKIEAWLDRPADNGLDADDLVGVQRMETCLIEIWVECLGRDAASYGQLQAQQLGRAMKKIEGWSSIGPRLSGKFGQQRIYRRSDHAMAHQTQFAG